MVAIPSYRAEMVGLSERDRTLLRSLLAATQARTGRRWDGGPGQPQVYFIDIDGQAGAEFWQSLAEDARRDSAIVLSIAPPTAATHWLPKPLRSVSLLGVLEQMTLPVRVSAPATLATGSGPAPGATGTARVRNANEPLALLDVFDEPPAATARVMQSPHWPDLVIGSGNTHVMRTASVDRYIEGFTASIAVDRVAKYTGGPLSDELRMDLDTLRWLAMLHAPLGEIMRRLPRPERARLRTLPAFGHLPHTLQHVRMAAWLTQHPASPRELADMTGADDETVLRFLGACAAIGLLQELVETVPAPVAPPTFVAQPAAEPEAEPEPVTEEAPIVAVAEEVGEAESVDEVPVLTVAQPVETMSVLERLRASREQNRARVAAAIRGASSA
jgi:hypothetical protein